MKIILKRILVALSAMTLFGCGGGGSTAGACLYVSCQTDASASAADIIVQMDAKVGNTASGQNVVTATVLNSSGQVLADIPVTVSADANTQVIASATKTDAKGVLEATVLTGLKDQSDRTVNVTVKAGSVVRTGSFSISGTKIAATVVGASVAPGAAVRIIYSVTDINSNPMSGQLVSVTRSEGGSAVVGTTDASGSVTYNFFAPSTAGNYSVTASVAGVSNAGAPSEYLVVTGGSSSVPAVSEQIVAASISVNPSVVTVGGTSTVRALFQGANNKAIKNVRVKFNFDGNVNSIPGALSTEGSIVYSTANGEAVATYTAGTRASPTDGVSIKACYGYTDADLSGLTGDNCKVFSTGPVAPVATLTVVSEPVSISIVTNTLLIDNIGTYIQEFDVTAADSAGRAMKDVEITPSIDLTKYYKGRWTRPGSVWVKEASNGDAITIVADDWVGCDNEDSNRNGVLDGGEDINANGSLDPRKADVLVSLADPSVTKTDATGKIKLRIEYGKNLGSWLDYVITVSGKVTGSEGRAQWNGSLKVLRSDVTADAEPAFAVNKYGRAVLCTNPN